MCNLNKTNARNLNWVRRLWNNENLHHLSICISRNFLHLYFGKEAGSYLWVTNCFDGSFRVFCDVIVSFADVFTQWTKLGWICC